MAPRALRGGLIGCGYASGFQLKAWEQIPEARIVALASRDGVKLESRGREFGISKRYADYRRMLDEEDLDFVDIATPPEAHLEMAREAARRGMAVICQKPLADTWEQLREIVDICRSFGATLIVNENGRFQPWYRKMAELLESGRIGRPFSARFIARKRGSLPQPSFSRSYFSSMKRFALLELGVHLFDTARYLFGEAQRIYATTHRASERVAGEDVACALASFSGVTVGIDISWASVPYFGGSRSVAWCETVVEGTEGTLHLRSDGVLRILDDRGEETLPFPEQGEQMGYELAQWHFAQCLLQGTPCETSGEETLKTMEMVFGAYRSAEQNQVVALGGELLGNCEKGAERAG